MYPEEDIIFIKMYDPQQHIYGLPDYIGGVHSALLNSEAVIFAAVITIMGRIPVAFFTPEIPA